MTYRELVNQGQSLTQQAVEEGLRGLLRDNRMACLAAWLDRNREFQVAKLAIPATSELPGKLAHAAGAVSGIMALQSQLASLCEAPPGVAIGREESDV